MTTKTVVKISEDVDYRHELATKMALEKSIGYNQYGRWMTDGKEIWYYEHITGSFAPVREGFWIEECFDPNNDYSNEITNKEMENHLEDKLGYKVQLTSENKEKYQGLIWQIQDEYDAEVIDFCLASILDEVEVPEYAWNS